MQSRFEIRTIRSIGLANFWQKPSLVRIFVWRVRGDYAMMIAAYGIASPYPRLTHGVLGQFEVLKASARQRRPNHPAAS